MQDNIMITLFTQFNVHMSLTGENAIRTSEKNLEDRIYKLG